MTAFHVAPTNTRVVGVAFFTGGVVLKAQKLPRASSHTVTVERCRSILSGSAY